MATEKTGLKRALENVRKDPLQWEKGFTEFNNFVPAKYTVHQDALYKTEDKKALDTVFDLLIADAVTPQGARRAPADKLFTLLEAIRRLLLFRILYKALAKNAVLAVIECLKHPDFKVVTSAIWTVDNLFTFLGCTSNSGPRPDSLVLSCESGNKLEFAVCGGITELLKLVFRLNPDENPAALAALLRLLGNALNSGSKSTPIEAVNALSTVSPELATELVKLSLHKDPSISYAASHFIEGIVVHGKAEYARNIQDEALCKGYTLRHLYRVLYASSEVSESKDSEEWLISGRSEAETAQDLFGALVENHSDAIKCIFRIIPRNFQDPLTEPQANQILLREDTSDFRIEDAPKQTREHRGTIVQRDKNVKPTVSTQPPIPASGNPSSIVWAKYVSKRNSRSNWSAVFRDIAKDFNKPHILWNENCRDDLKRHLEAEINEIMILSSKDPNFSWDYEGYEVVYPTLEAELQVDSFFVRLLIPALENEASDYEVNPTAVSGLVNHLYNRSVIEDDPILKFACLRALSAVYRKYKDMLHVKTFDPLPYLVWLLNPKNCIPIWIDHILDFLFVLLTYQGNARIFLKEGGLDCIILHMAQVHIVSEEEKDDIPAIFSTRKSIMVPQARVATRMAWNVPPKPYNKYQVADHVLQLINELIEQLPWIRKTISKSCYMTHLIQFILCDEKKLSKKAILLIADILKHSPWMVSQLVSTGFFEFLLFAIPDSPDPCNVEIFDLIYQSHLRQNEALIPKGESALHMYFPAPMVRLLCVSGADQFLRIFNAQSDEPHLLWDQDLRDVLYDQIKVKCGPFKQQLNENPLALYQWVYPSKINYPSIDDEICIGTMYLRLYNERKRKGYTCNFAEYWAQHLVAAMNLELSDKNLGYLLDAHRTAVERHGHLPPFQNYKYFPQLFKTLVRSLECETDVYLVQLAADSLTGLLTLHPVEKDFNPISCFDHEGVQAVSVAIMNVVSKDFQIDEHRKLLIDLLIILDILAKKVKSPIVSILAQDKKLLAEIAKVLDYEFASQFPTITIQALTTIRSCADFEELRQCFLENGAVIHIIYLTIFVYFDADNRDSEQSFVVINAAVALSGLCGYHPNSPALDENLGIRKVLRALITPGLHRELVNPYNYIEAARSNWNNPTLIWNEELRLELKAFLRSEIEEIRKSCTFTKWDEHRFPFYFQGLRKEIIVDDVFVYLYNVQDDMIHNSPENYMQALLQAISRAVISFDKQEKSDKEIGQVFHYVTTCSFAITRLIKWHPDVLNSGNKDLELEILNELFENSNHNPHVLHSALLILEQMATFDLTTVEFVNPYKHILHRLLNFPRNQNLANLPSLQLSLHILSELCLRNSSVTGEFITSGLVVSLLYMFANNLHFWPEHRLAAGRLMGILCNDSEQGPLFRELLCKLTSPTFKDLFLDCKNDAKKFMKVFDSDTDTPVRFWTENCRKDLLVFLESEIAAIRENQSEAWAVGVAAPPYNWEHSTVEERFQKWTLRSQICVDEVYVNAFNSNPFFQVKSDRFFAMLINALHKEWAKYIQARESDDDEHVKSSVSVCMSLWEAVNHIITNLPHLQDLCVPELEFLFGYFDKRVHTPLTEIALKMSCSLASNPTCAESIAKQGLLCKIMPLLVTMDSKTVDILNFMMDLIRRSSPSVKQIRSLGGIIILINILLQRKPNKNEKKTAAQVLSAMIQDKTFGKASGDYAARVLTAEFRQNAFQARPEKFVSFIGSDHESSDDNRQWGDDERDALRQLFATEVKHLAEIMPSWDGKQELFDTSKLGIVWKDLASESKEQ